MYIYIYICIYIYIGFNPIDSLSGEGGGGCYFSCSLLMPPRQQND